MKMVDRLPEGYFRTFLEENVKYSPAVIAVATGYFVASVSDTSTALVETKISITDLIYRDYIEFTWVRQVVFPVTSSTIFSICP